MALQATYQTGMTLWAISLASTVYGKGCNQNEFACLDRSGCIGAHLFCDGRRQCEDGSDEIYRNNSSLDDGNITFCRRLDKWRGVSRICILQGHNFTSAICPGHNCLNDEFACHDGSACLKPSLFCDGTIHCSDGSDEIYFNSTSINNRDVSFCRARYRKRLKSSSRKCALQGLNLVNKNRLCEGPCRSDEFVCDNGSTCVPSAWFCDGDHDCRDETDEMYRNRSLEYDANVTFCRIRPLYTSLANICALPDRNMLLKDDYCKGDACEENEFACVGGSQCIKAFFFCDGVRDCRDGSDELTSDTETDFQSRQCFSQLNQNECMLPEDYICDGVQHCDHGIDECLCDGKGFLDEKCFKCISEPSRIIPVSNLCDGKMDCSDFYDECLCPLRIRPKICSEIIWDDNSETSERQPYISCISNTTGKETKINASAICNERNDCFDGRDEAGCVGVLPTESTHPECKWDAGVSKTSQVECEESTECDAMAEINCSCRMKPIYCEYRNFDAKGYKEKRRLCQYTNGKGHCSLSNKTTISDHQRFGLIAENTPLEEICNGKKFCENFADEVNCSSRFYCTKNPLPNIAITKRCDGYIDCENKADEINCSCIRCDDEGALKFITGDKLCDGNQDCKSGYDECLPGCIDSAFSNEESMIVNKAMLAFVWIISFIALVGCAIVITMTGYHLLKQHLPQQESDGPRLIYKRLIMSLSVSDFMVAIFTMAICIKSAQLDHNYCLEDRHWRSSGTCTGLGAILVIGSEQSVFTMLLIAIQRLYAIARPFSQPKIRHVTVAIIISWVISILLGIIPLLSMNEDYFVNSVAFSENYIFKTIRENETKYMIKWLKQMVPKNTSAYDNGSTNWSKLKNLIAVLDPKIKVKYEFGYYSTHTVCLPTLFPDPTQETAWSYSLMLLIINFTAFSLMLAAYAALYRLAVTKDSSQHKQRKEENVIIQRKLTRIVVTDFLCWMPICIMGFLQLAGVNIANDAYLPAGLLLIPINSALNPLLYSDMPEIMNEKWKRFKRSCTSRAPLQSENISLEMTIDTFR